MIDSGRPPTERLRPRTVAALSVPLALVAQTPDGRGYYPMGRAMWEMAFGDVGHGPRAFWLAWTFVEFCLYVAGLWMLIRLGEYLLHRIRRIA